MNTILMIDDDIQYMNTIRDYLTKQDFIVYCANSFKTALPYMKESIDCVILDIKLQDNENGYEICQKIKSEINIPIIFLSNYAQDDNRIHGFLSGADDFLGKPCNLEELRIRILKRIHPTIKLKQKEQIRFGDLWIDAIRHKAFYKDELILLTDAEFNILYFLATHEHMVFSQYEIYDHLWKEPVISNAHTVQVHISSTRKKLNKICPNHEYIQTVWGKGYQFIGIHEKD